MSQARNYDGNAREDCIANEKEYASVRQCFHTRRGGRKPETMAKQISPHYNRSKTQCAQCRDKEGRIVAAALFSFQNRTT